MSIPSIYRTDAMGGIADSIMHGFLHPEDDWGASFCRGVKNKFSPMQAQPARPTGLADNVGRPIAVVQPPSARIPTGYAAQQWPSFYVNAVPGRKVGDISGSMASVLAPFIAARVTVYIVELATNDVSVTPAATFIPQVQAIRDAIVAAPFFRMLIWITPFAAGENWPDGANIFDLSVDGLKDKDDQITAAMAATPNCYTISWRALRLQALNATSNPTHAAQGIYTYDGTHPTFASTGGGLVSGEQLLTDYTISQMSFG